MLILKVQLKINHFKIGILNFNVKSYKYHGYIVLQFIISKYLYMMHIVREHHEDSLDINSKLLFSMCM